MAYEYKEEVLYGRALFSIINQDQSLYVAFEPKEGDSFIMIIFAEKGEAITDHHNTELWDTLYDILLKFDKERFLDYEIVVT